MCWWRDLDNEEYDTCITPKLRFLIVIRKIGKEHEDILIYEQKNSVILKQSVLDATPNRVCLHFTYSCEFLRARIAKQEESCKTVNLKILKLPDKIRHKPSWNPDKGLETWFSLSHKLLRKCGIFRLRVPLRPVPDR